MVASQRFAEVLEELVGGADIVLVDSSALLAVGDSAAIAARVGTLLFVVNSAQVKRPMLERAHAQLAKLPCRKLGLAVITAERSAGVYYGYHYHRAPAATAKRGRT
jgi:Mrp family chromosome partitioning ATPase